jgi:hypothetical protein
MPHALLDPIATYDCLFIGCRLQHRLGRFSPAEVHLLGYLGCLLSLYRKSPVTDWGYGFIGTEFGAPYSQELDTAIYGLIEGQLFLEDGDLLVAGESSHGELELLGGLSLFDGRDTYLNGACGSILAFPVGVVREALSFEPELNRAKALASTRELLSGPGMQLLYDQFDALSNALGTNSLDLRLPALVWLTALAHEAVPR